MRRITEVERALHEDVGFRVLAEHVSVDGTKVKAIASKLGAGGTP